MLGLYREHSHGDRFGFGSQKQAEDEQEKDDDIVIANSKLRHGIVAPDDSSTGLRVRKRRSPASVIALRDAAHLEQLQADAACTSAALHAATWVLCSIHVL